MPKFDTVQDKIPVGPLKLLIMDSAKTLGEQVDHYLVDFRHNHYQVRENNPAFVGYIRDSYSVDHSIQRDENGEGSGRINESVRGCDLYILTDVMNHTIPYKMYGFTNYKSPDDIYQDLKRVIAATVGQTKRINVIMPFIYEGRQHKRNGRESLDAAQMILEMRDMGVQNFVTFDAHDPRVSNASPLGGFDNFMPSYQFLKALLYNVPDFKVDREHLMIISPDEGAVDRAVYFANVLGVGTGMFYKRRDYAHVVNGMNPIVAHEFLGEDLHGKDAVIIDDMISSGGSMIDTATQLKERGAGRVLICTTFGLFANGFEKFDKAYRDGVFDYVVCTNLVYQQPELLKKEYFITADMSEYLAAVIDFMNHDASLTNILEPTDKIHQFLEKYNNGLIKATQLNF